jgi:hypothetical protein
MRDQESTMEARWESRKTRVLDPAAQEQDQLPPTTILTKSGNQFAWAARWGRNLKRQQSIEARNWRMNKSALDKTKSGRTKIRRTDKTWCGKSQPSAENHRCSGLGRENECGTEIFASETNSDWHGSQEGKKQQRSLAPQGKTSASEKLAGALRLMSENWIVRPGMAVKIGKSTEKEPAAVENSRWVKQWPKLDSGGALLARTSEWARVARTHAGNQNSDGVSDDPETETMSLNPHRTANQNRSWERKWICCRKQKRHALNKRNRWQWTKSTLGMEEENDKENLAGEQRAEKTTSSRPKWFQILARTVGRKPNRTLKKKNNFSIDLKTSLQL